MAGLTATNASIDRPAAISSETAPKEKKGAKRPPQQPASASLRDSIARWILFLGLLLLVVRWLHRPQAWLFVASGTILVVSIAGHITLRRRPAETPEKTEDVKSGLGAIRATSFLLLLATGPRWQSIVAHREVHGEVLVVGGSTHDEILSTAELYNPVTGVFSPTGSMTTPRTDFAGVLLSNGKVLVTGGQAISITDSHWDTLDTAELYNPQTGGFSQTGRMKHRRGGHTETRLSDGRVLIAGGEDAHGLTQSAELYDPSSGTFVSTSPMNHARVQHKATLLRDGTVLVVGGIRGPYTAEVYDPPSDAFTNTGDMIANCQPYGATLLANGQVLVAGNDTRWMSSNNVAMNVFCAELYDPESRTFSRVTSSQSVCGPFALANLKSARVLLAGGSNDCVLGHKLNELRAEPEMTSLDDGRVLITGGIVGNLDVPNSHMTDTDTAEIYDPVAGRFTTTGKMSAVRALHIAVLLP